ncbi:MAG: hypothetical protein OHK0048_06720 [Rhodoferax sp.]
MDPRTRSQVWTRRLDAIFLIAFLAIGTGAEAQKVFKIVGADGHITYSDRPPSVPASAVQEARINGVGETALDALPYALRQVVRSYPVTLFTTATCAPCDQARTLLRQRGVVYSEKTIQSAEDAQALKAIAGASSVPVLRVGGQVISGFQPDTWNQYLSAAGYPLESQLPRSYVHPAPTPLTPPKPTVPAAQPAASEASSAPADKPSPSPARRRPDRPSPDNPAGIRF